MIQLTEDYLTKTAEAKARQFTGKLDKTQLRKYYDDFKLLERRLIEDESEERFKNELLPLVKFVKSKIAYGAGRKVGNKQLVPKEFKDYMDGEIDKITSIVDFKRFMLHYQAIISYFTFITTELEGSPRGQEGFRGGRR